MPTKVDYLEGSMHYLHQPSQEDNIMHVIARQGECAAHELGIPYAADFCR